MNNTDREREGESSPPNYLHRRWLIRAEPFEVDFFFLFFFLKFYFYIHVLVGQEIPNLIPPPNYIP